MLSIFLCNKTKFKDVLVRVFSEKRCCACPVWNSAVVGKQLQQVIKKYCPNHVSCDPLLPGIRTDGGLLIMIGCWSWYLLCVWRSVSFPEWHNCTLGPRPGHAWGGGPGITHAELGPTHSEVYLTNPLTSRKMNSPPSQLSVYGCC